MLKVLFLDIDGVLNAHDFCQKAMCGPIHRDKVMLLNRVLQTTGSHVVLSSAWRYLVVRGEMNLTGLDWLLRSHGLHERRLVGFTRPDTMIAKATEKWDGRTSWPQENERGTQIKDWLAGRHQIQKVAVVDDMDLGISRAGLPLVMTNGTVGMTADDAERLIEILGCVGQ